MRSRSVVLVLMALLSGCADPATDAARLQEAVTIPAGAGRFHELDLQMSLGQKLEFAWSIEDADSTVLFNIHLHRDGAVQTPVRGTYHDLSGSYEATSNGTVSFYWENRHPRALPLQYVITGQFERATAQAGAADLILP